MAINMKRWQLLDSTIKKYEPNGTEGGSPIHLLYNGHNHYDFIRIVEQQQPQEQQQRQIVANNEGLLNKPIINQLIASESAQKMDCNAVCIEYSSGDDELVKQLGISNPDAHKWLLQRITNFRRTRASLKIDSLREKMLHDMEFIQPGVRPPIHNYNLETSHDVVKFTDSDGAQYELTYLKLKAYARAINEATMFVYKVNNNATEVQFWIERESVEQLSTKKSKYY